MNGPALRWRSGIPGAVLVQALAAVAVLSVIDQARTGAAALLWAVPVAVAVAALHVVALAGSPSVGRDGGWHRLLPAAATLAASGVLAHLAAPSWILLAILSALQVSQLLVWSVAPFGIFVVSAAVVLLGVGEMRWNYALLVLGSALIALLRGRLMRTIDELRLARKLLAEAAVEAERQRFSRDLHDLLGHSLSVIVVAAQVIRRTAQRDPAAAIGTAEDIEQTGRRALTEIRAAVRAYREDPARTVIDQAVAAAGTAGIEIAIVGRDLSMPPAIDVTMGWAIRESTTNVIRHSRAHRCAITLSDESTAFRLTISDDGTADDAARGRLDTGLVGLRQRLAAVSGTLEVSLARPSGLVIDVTVPKEQS